MKTNSFHTSFQLNEKVFSSSEELILYAESFSKELAFFLKEWFAKDSFITVKTSGSTGKPKDIQLQKEFIINSAFTTGHFFNVLENTTALCCLPIAFIAGKMMLIRALTLGWHLDIVLPSSEPLKTIEKHYDFSAMVPLQVVNSIDKLYLIKQLIIGGGVISYSLQQRLQEVSTHAFATYGMTETITHIAIKKLNNFQSTKPVLESHYKTVSNVQVSQDLRKCLVIDAPKVSSETIITNDVVEVISETEFIWKGRLDNVINSGGIKLHPEEIEQKLFPAIASRFFVAGLVDQILGERLILVIEAEAYQLDDELLQVLSTRMKVAQKIGEYKKNNDITILQTNRWNEILERAVAKGNKMGLSDDFITKYMDAVHMESIQQQNKIMNS